MVDKIFMFLGLKPLKSCYTVWEHDPAWKMLRFGPRNPLRHVKPRISTQNRIRSTRDEEITKLLYPHERATYIMNHPITQAGASQQRREFYTRARRLSTRIVHDTVPHATRDTALTQSPHTLSLTRARIGIVPQNMYGRRHLPPHPSSPWNTNSQRACKRTRGARNPSVPPWLS